MTSGTSLQLYFSDVFEVDPNTLESYGAFNISLVNDLPLFIDPFLLFNSERDEYQALHAEIIQYLRFLKDMAATGSLTDGHLRAWFMFSEVKQNWLGFSLVGNKGSGLGIDFARALSANLETLFTDFGQEQITRDSHLEKLCLVKDGVGKDNISDLTTNLIKRFLLTYTETFAKQQLVAEQCREVPIPRAYFNYQTRSWVSMRYCLPWHDDDYVILTPKDILTKDDTWINRSDLSREFNEVVEAVPNDALRAQINDYFRRILPDEPKNSDFTEAISRAIHKYPELIDFFIRRKEDLGDQAVSLSQQNVQDIELLYIRQLSEFVRKLDASSGFYATGADTYEETRARVEFLKDVIAPAATQIPPSVAT